VGRRGPVVSLREALAVLLFAVSAAAGLAAAVPAANAGVPATIVDRFESTDGWSAHPADGVDLSIRPDAGPGTGGSMRLDFRFGMGSGYAVAHRVVSLDLPDNYAFTFRIRGNAPSNHLEFKLIDSTGANVWWCVRRDVHFPEAWETYRIKKRQISFAWGPQGGGEIRHVAAIEFSITAGSGGTGSVWIGDLEMVPLPPPSSTSPPPIATATSSRAGAGAPCAIDGDSTSAWRSAPADRRPVLTLDLREDREYGGLVLDWKPRGRARAYAVEASDDGASWRLLREVRDGGRDRDYLFLPESESRFLRIRATENVGRNGIALREAVIEPLAWGASLESFFSAIARDAPRGCYPRAVAGEQTFWTVVGDDAGDREEGLLGEDGLLETGKGCFSIEPFLWLPPSRGGAGPKAAGARGRLITWNDVRTSRSLDRPAVPIPTVRWETGDLGLDITAFAVDVETAAHLLGRADSCGASILARYRVTNRGSARIRATLYLALRPFQVNPPAQFLNSPGGTAPIRDLAREGDSNGRGAVIRVNGDRGIVPLDRPSGFGAATFDEGDIVADNLRSGRLPGRPRVRDAFGHASGALAYDLDLAPGADREVDLLVPLHGGPIAPLGQARLSGPSAEAAERACRERWLAHRRGIEIAVPDSVRDLIDTMWAQLAYILVNRDGAAIQPGSRSYERSWIRDGALTSSALLRLGHSEIVRDFIEWFASNQYANGKIPCVVDSRGPDPVPEHDSSGEFIFLIAEYDRYVPDRAFLEKMWPRVRRAVSYLDSLRATRRTAEYLTPENRRFRGLLPPSISHEGYSAKPMHSYWDDLWALRGFKDAARIAGELDLTGERDRITAIRDEFAADLTASIRETMGFHKIDYVPGCADLGDFDATSTTIALDPVGAQAIVPEEPLRRTFERYWEFFIRRRDGIESWEAFTPYEIRNIGAFVELGWRDRALDLVRYFLEHRVPPEWEQWPEVVWRDPRVPKFIGDLPHTWVGSDYVRSVLDMFAYTRDADGALVIGAGIPLAWTREAPGVIVRNLPTPYGPLSYSMRGDRDSILVSVEDGLRIPPGGIVVQAPGQDAGTVIASLPATVVLRTQRPIK